MSRPIPFVSAWLKRRGRRRLRGMMRGYRVMRATGRLDWFTEIGEAMTNTPFRRIESGAARMIFGAAVDRAETCARQYALIRVTRFTMNQSLLLSLGTGRAPVVHPLPAEWRAILEQQGFKVAKVRSAVAWQGYVFLLWGFGVLTIARRVFANLSAWRRSSNDAPGLGRYAFFDRLTADNLPRPYADGRSYDILTWYEQWPGRARVLDTICHGVAGARPTAVNGIAARSVASALPPLERVGLQLRFLAWGIAATFLAAADALRGRWWHALLLAEASSAATARLLEPGRLAQDYLFHIVGSLYRPLWTYEAERRGSRIILYNYSTNIETFKRPDGYHTQANSWQAITWPVILVWDEGQADFYRRAAGDHADIQIVGPIGFTASDKEMPPLSLPAVAVFDVQPVRDSLYQMLGLPDEFHTPKTVNQFLLDVHAAVSDAGGVMLLKRKRKVGRLAHPLYVAVVNRLAGAPGFMEIEPEIPSGRVIEHCQAVIAMPFSSPALQGRAMGKPSIYYDPHGSVQLDDRAGHGMTIVGGHAELARWVAAHIHSKPA